ncbi:MAG: carboxylesterase/lipase family protein, partial [Vicinamibacteraceae bacterium]
ALGGDPSVIPPLGPTSEDCLSLNVWTTNLGGKTKQPVMVWLHGGSFTIGSGGEEASSLASLGVVVVTLNYRLGLLGFMAHPELTKESPHASSGNYGLLDQIAALRSVQRNIAAFGGDPDRVTLFGHSSGAGAVLQLMASPLAQGLFHRAISQSGSLGDSQPLAAAEAMGVEIATRLGVQAANALQGLRAMPVERLLEVAPRGFEAVTDGWLLPEPVTAFLADRPNGMPLLVGATANEASIFALPSMARGAYRDMLRENSTSHAERLLALYPAASDDETSAAATRYMTDQDFVCPARYAAARSTPTWLYLVSAPPAASPSAQRHGPFHGSDLRFLFKADTGVPLSGSGETVRDAMRRYWVRFAATGNPNEPGLPEWPVYDEARPRHLDFGDTIRAISGLGRPGCDLFDEMRDTQQ